MNQHSHDCKCGSETHNCPCGSGLGYEQCCQVFHNGNIPADALQLMKSRFAAYALNIPDYIIETTHPASQEYSDNKFSWKRKISLFSTHYSFNKLEIHDFKENGSFASVTFTAFISLKDEDNTYTESSYFEKLNDRWFYRNGKSAQGRVPELVPAKLDLLSFTYYGNPILRRKADPINEITDEIRQLVDQMIQTLEAGNGAGLAAPQINRSIRLFLVKTPIEHEDGRIEYGNIKVIINPKLSAPSKETCPGSEGCLSIPSIRSDVERPTEINVEYTNLDGEKIEARLTGWEARVFMHENDHINGVLFIDRLDAKEKANIAPLLLSLEKRLQLLTSS